MSILNWFIPKQRDFYDMLIKQSEKTLEGLDYLKKYLTTPTTENAEAVIKCEAEADDLRLHLVFELNDAFVTPIDREDIFRLSRSIDDIIDYAKKTVKEITIYNILPSPYMQRMGDALFTGTQELNIAINHLRKDLRLSAAHASAAKKAENIIEYLYHEALANLFEEKDTIFILNML